MSGFFRKFLHDDARALNAPNGRQISLAIFGKHPGWDDHLPDLGLETESLHTARSLLYVEGIGGQITSGAWKMLEPEQRLDSFHHWWLWARAEQFIVGQLWTSSDRKGRKLYPMVVCGHCFGCPLPLGLAELVPRLEQVRESLVATETAGEVEAIFTQARNELRARVGQMVPPEALASPADHVSFIDSPVWGSDYEPLLRILYKIRNDWGAYRCGQRLTDSETALTPLPPSGSRVQPGLRPQSIRLPAVGSSVTEVFLQWREFFRSQVDPDIPILFTLPQTLAWLDVLVGRPTSQEFFSLRASLKALPLTSEVPYHLDEEFRDAGKRFIQQYREQPASEFPPVRKAWRGGLTLATLLLLLSLFAAYLRYTPGRQIPSFLHPAARLLGNSAL